MSILVLIVSEKYLNERSQLILENHLDSIIYRLQSDHIISQTWLAQMETANQLIIYIEENNKPLLYSGTLKTVTNRKSLITEIKTMIGTNQPIRSYSTSDLNYDISSLCFNLYTENQEHFLVISSTISSASSYQIILMKYMKKDDLQILNLRILFSLLASISIICLTLFSWWFVGKVIHPIGEYQRKQTAFIAAASHELRSPLAVLQTNISALQYKTVTDPDKYISIVINECTRMSRLVDDLLLLANLDTQNWLSLNLKDTDLDTLIIELYELFLPLAKLTDHHLLLNLPHDFIPPIQIDSERLQQAIIILIDNALNYTPAGTSITLALKQKNYHVIIQVIDNGPGIPDSNKHSVFDRFYRVDPSRSQKEHFGLGLSIAHEIIQLHKGTLSLNDTPGGGCTFSICLPQQIGV